ncbi:MAG: glycolate oxidase subunit GlcF [Pseudomonadota bacterium]
METAIPPELLARPEIAEADRILRACVHCGFCNATCPTYQLLGSEPDGPRGRIYLIKGMLEGSETTAKTQLHLDRCLTCRACETTCPSGVQYGRLVDIGRQFIEERVARTYTQKMIRRALLGVLPYRNRLRTVLQLGNLLRPLLPPTLRTKVPPLRSAAAVAPVQHVRRMLVLQGCVQPLSTPATNAAATRVLDKLGITLLSAPAAGCCGALNLHLADADGARTLMRRNIDAWWPYVEQDIEAIVVTASGCGVMVKDYGHELKNDPDYAAKAARISALARDLSEVVRSADLAQFSNAGAGVRVACQSSCTLQHGQKLAGAVEGILQRCGYTLTTVADSHLCCGAAGTYTLLQPELSKQLLDNKLAALQQNAPDIIVTANIGCQLHLEGASAVPVKHWIELLDRSPA